MLGINIVFAFFPSSSCCWSRACARYVRSECNPSDFLTKPFNKGRGQQFHHWRRVIMNEKGEGYRYVGGPRSAGGRQCENRTRTV